MRNACGWAAVLLLAWSSVSWSAERRPIQPPGEDVMEISLSDTYKRLNVRLVVERNLSNQRVVELHEQYTQEQNDADRGQ